MAIVALVLWLFTAGAGITLLVRSNLGRAHPSPVLQEQAAANASPAARSQQVPVTSVAATLPATTSSPAAAASLGAAPSPLRAAPSPLGATQAPPSKAETRRAIRARFDPPSLVASRSAPLVPGPRALLEFLHPACAIVGLGFWLGFTLVHTRLLGWIAFGLITVTAFLGLTWFAASNRAAQRQQPRDRDSGDPAESGDPAPAFSGRLAAVHGAAAAITFVLAAVSALVLKG